MGAIEFACDFCKQTLEATDDMAGQIVDCPNCQKPITIPAPKPPAASPKPVPAPAPARSAPPPRPAPQSKPEPAARTAAPAAAPTCPECASPMEPGSVLCLKCGFHTKLGKKIQTEFT